jgi:hypothetical protein
MGGVWEEITPEIEREMEEQVCAIYMFFLKI